MFILNSMKDEINCDTQETYKTPKLDNLQEILIYVII